MHRFSLKNVVRQSEAREKRFSEEEKRNIDEILGKTGKVLYDLNTHPDTDENVVRKQLIEIAPPQFDDESHWMVVCFQKKIYLIHENAITENIQINYNRNRCKFGNVFARLK